MEQLTLINEILGNRFIFNTVDLHFKILNPAFGFELASFVSSGVNYQIANFVFTDFFAGLSLFGALFVSVIFNGNLKRWASRVATIYLAGKGVGIMYGVFFTSFTSFTVLNGAYTISLQTEVFKFIIVILWLACLQLMTFSRTVYSVLTYFIFVFGILAVSSNNLLLLFLCIEGVSLSAYLLALASQTFGGVSAAAKYFVFGSLGSIFIIGGVVNLYPLHPSLSVWTLYNTLQISSSAEWPLSLIFIGLLIKLGTAPFHIWLPDVYGGVSFMAVLVYSLLSKAIILFSFLDLIHATGFNYSHSVFIEGMAIISLVVGCYGAVRQFEIKKFIAYSSIVQMGFILSSSADVAFFYIVVYLISLYIFLFSVVELVINGRELTYLSDLRFIKNLKIEVVLLVSSLFSLAGIPPFLGFYSKFLVGLSVIEDIYLFNDFMSIVLLFINLIVATIIIFYYSRLIISSFAVDLNSVEKKYFVISRMFSTPLTLVVLSLGLLLLGGFIFNGSMLLLG